jgi:hypothetical protein
MPILQVTTNVSKESITENFAHDLAQELANTLSKPLGYCAVHILPGLNKL